MPPTMASSGILAGLKPGAVVRGVVVDWALSMGFSILITRSFLDPGVWNVDDSQFDAAFTSELEAMYQDPSFLWVSMLAGVLATVVGAYVGARRAGTLPLKHGLAVAVATGLTGLLLYFLPGNGGGPTIPLWYNVAGWLVLIPAGILGGYIVREQARKAGSD